MKNYPNSKTRVYIDAANIILSAKDKNFDIDVLKLVTYLSDVFRPEKIIYFSADFSFMQTTFLLLESKGVEVTRKKIYSENNKTKANCDVEISSVITVDLKIGNVDNFVLVSGDGDFVYLLDLINQNNKKVKVLAFDAMSCSRVIKHRSFAKISYLIELGELLKNEKPPAST